MVQKMGMDFTKSGGGKVNVQMMQPISMISRFNKTSKVSLGATLAHSVEMKQMLRRLQGLPSGCSSCGGKK
tara:strand:- start:46 stop:258 length:213 start_codon:yes stop_codon:yes gene_type:complete